MKQLCQFFMISLLLIFQVLIREFLKSTFAVDSYNMLGKLLLLQLSALVAYYSTKASTISRFLLFVLQVLEYVEESRSSGIA